MTEFDLYTANQLLEILDICNKHAITLESIIKCAKLLGVIGDYGKLDLYIRILFDGACATGGFDEKIN